MQEYNIAYVGLQCIIPVYVQYIIYTCFIIFTNINQTLQLQLAFLL